MSTEIETFPCLRCIALRDKAYTLLAVGMVCPDGSVVLRWLNPSRTAIYANEAEVLSAISPELVQSGVIVQVLYSEAVPASNT